MKYTANYNLKKPEGTDVVNIDDLNENADIIDQKLKELEDGVYNVPPNSVDDAAIGSRTPDQSQAPASPGTGTLTQLISWLANRIKAITGKTNWWDAPPTTLQAVKNHIDAAAPHSGHETPSGAQAKANAALNSAKAYTDQEVSEVAQDLAEHQADGASHSKTARFVVGTSTAGWTLEDCDYLCDGTNDQEEIIQALNDLPATGGEVVILDGTYNITATIDVTKDNVSIKGNGNATILKRGWNATGSASSVNSPIIFCGRNNCLISNLAIDGNKGIYTASFNTNISIEGSNNILTNISANNCASNSVWVSGSFNKIIFNKVIGNPNNSGIHLAGDFNIVCGNECRDNYYQINLNGANNNIITSNICIRGTGLPSDYGSSYATINLFGSTNNYNLIAMNNCMGKAPVVGGGTGNTLVNNKFNET